MQSTTQAMRARPPQRFFWALLGLLALTQAGCSRAKSSEPSASDDATELRYQGQPGVVTFPELAEDLGFLAPLKLKHVGSTISGPQDIQTVATGDIEFGLAFHGAILKLIAAKAPIQAVIGGYGVDEQTFSSFFVLADSPIKGARDLVGKRVAMNTLGAHSEFLLREYLLRNGVSAEDAKKVTLLALPPINIEQALREKQVDAVALTSIFRDKALERGGVRQLFSDYELYGTFTAGSYVFHRKFIADHPRAVRKFVEGTAKAIEWARRTPRESVIARHKAIIEKRKRNEDSGLANYWRSTGIAGSGGSIRDRELEIWREWLIRDKQLTPKQLALSDVYTNAFNPSH